jgi:FtsH-binding integral membrane protein
MAGTVEPTKPRRFARINLNSDGRPHPRLNAASGFTLVVGLVSFAIGLLLRTEPGSLTAWAVTAAATGLAGLLIGLVAQMMSATREQRVVVVAGMIAAFVGLCLGLAHGGLG